MGRLSALLAAAAGVGVALGVEENCLVTPQNAEAGVAVRRGPSWKWGSQDSVGFGVLLGKAAKCNGGDWWKVRWGDNPLGNTYRVGCSGSHDLALHGCGTGAAGQASVCAFNDLYWPEGAVPKNIHNTSCGRDVLVDVGGACGFDRPGHSCEAVVCNKLPNGLGAWSNVRPKCIADEATLQQRSTCKFDDLMPPQGAVPSGRFAGCYVGGRVPAGDHCMFRKEGASCEVATCIHAGSKARWASPVVTCTAERTLSVAGCAYSSLSTPVGAAAAGDNCAPGETVKPGGYCIFSKKDENCDVAVCNADGRWAATLLGCTPAGCPFSEIKVPSGVLATGEGCAPGGSVKRGAFCSFAKEAALCDLALCGTDKVWSTTTPNCRPTGTPRGGLAPAQEKPKEVRDPNCFRDIQYSVARAGNVNLLGGDEYKQSKSSEDCAGQCKATEGCKCFTWHGNGDRCFLLSQCDTPTPRARVFNFLSGNNRCVPTLQTFVGNAEACALTLNKVKKGLRVVRGPDWRWKEQDGFGPGSILRVDRQCKGGAWVRMKWDRTGVENVYRAGCNGKYDLCLYDPQKGGTSAVAAAMQTATAVAPPATAKAPAPAAPAPPQPPAPSAPAPAPEPAPVLPATPPAAGGRGAPAAPTGRGAAVAAVPAVEVAPAPRARGGGGRGGRGSGAGRGAPPGRGAAPVTAAPSGGRGAGQSAAAGGDFDCQAGSRLAGQRMFEVQWVQSLKDCVLQCQRIPACTAVDYNEKKDCNMYKGNVEHISTKTSSSSCARITAELPVVPPTATEAAEAAKKKAEEEKAAAEKKKAGDANFQCSPRRVFPGGDLFHFLDVPTRASCQEYCANVPECVGFVYRSATHTCTLKAFLTSPEAAETTDVEACIRFADGPKAESTSAGGDYECKQGMQYVGSDLMVMADVADSATCQSYCTRVDDCTALTFHNRVCSLRGGEATMLDADDDSLACAKPGVRPTVGEKQTQDIDAALAVTGSSRRPHPLEHLDSACPDGKNYTLVGGLYLNTYDMSTTTERPLCFGYNCTPDSNFAGGDWFRLIGIDTIEQCEEACNNIPLCVGFVHRAACPSVLPVVRAQRAPRCKTCDIKCVVGELEPDTEPKHSMACKSLTRQGCEEKRVRIVLRTDVNCRTTPLFASEAERTAFVDALEAHLNAASLTPGSEYPIDDVQITDVFGCTRQQDSWEEDKIYQQAVCKNLTGLDTVTEATPPCGDGWTPVPGSSTECFKVFPTPTPPGGVTWEGANTRCQQQGGWLATINSETANAAIFAQLSTGEGCWIGLTDQATEGVNVWYKDGSTPTYTKYTVAGSLNDQPDHDCFYMRPPGTETGHWDNDDCNATFMPRYACVRPTRPDVCYTRVVLAFSFPNDRTLQQLVDFVNEIEPVVDSFSNGSLVSGNVVANAVEPECKELNDTTDMPCIPDKTGKEEDIIFVEEQVRLLQECINKCDLYVGPGDDGPCMAVSWDESKKGGTCTLYGAAHAPYVDEPGTVLCRKDHDMTPAPTGMHLTLSVVLPMTVPEWEAKCKDLFIGNVTAWLKPLFPVESNFSEDWVDVWAKDIPTGEYTFYTDSPTSAAPTSAPSVSPATSAPSVSPATSAPSVSPATSAPTVSPSIFGTESPTTPPPTASPSTPVPTASTPAPIIIITAFPTGVSDSTSSSGGGPPGGGTRGRRAAVLEGGGVMGAQVGPNQPQPQPQPQQTLPQPQQTLPKKPKAANKVSRGISIEIRIRQPPGNTWAGPMPSIPTLGHQQALAKAAVKTLRIIQPRRYSCTTTSSWHGGVIEARSGVATADECLRICGDSPSCEKTLYVLGADGQYSCVLMTEAAESAPAVDRPFVACSVEGTERTGTGSYDCQEDAAWVGGDLFAIPGVPSAADCRTLCDEITSDCSLYVYSGDTCTLKNLGEAAQIPKEDARETGLACKSTSDSTPLVEYTCADGAYVGGDLFQIESVSTLRECQTYCFNVAGCSVVSWSAAGRKCSLKSSDAAHLPSPEKGIVSCAREDANAVAPADSFHCETDIVYAGESLLEVGDVSDADECLKACQKLSECAVVSYHAQHCTMKAATAHAVDSPGAVSCVRAGLRPRPRDAPGLSTADAAIAAALQADALDSVALSDVVSEAYSCGGSHTYQGGTIRQVEEAASSEDCQRFCSQLGSCVAFVFGADRSCLLKDASAVRVSASEHSVVLSCSRQPAHSEEDSALDAATASQFHCSADTAYAGGDMHIISNVRTLADCERHCAEKRGCAVLVYTPRGTCHLKSSAAAAVPRRVVHNLIGSRASMVELPTVGMACLRSAQGAASAEKPAAAAVPDFVEGFQCELGRSYLGGELLQLADVSGEECQRQCSRVPQCAVVVFGADRTCSLRTAMAASMPAGNSPAVSCVRTFDAAASGGSGPNGFQCASGAAFEGAALLAVDGVGSAPDCAAHCTLFPGCELAVHHPNRTCALHGSDAAAVEGTTAAVACKRSSSAKAGRLIRGPQTELQLGWSCAQQDFMGGDLYVVEGVNSARQCQQQCARVPGCASLTYQEHTATCTLKSAAAQAASAGAVLGCRKVENPQAAVGAPECVCASNWVAEKEGGTCGTVQRGCPARTCDGSAQRWCRVINPGCATAQYGGWAYCDDSTKQGREGVLLSGRFGGLEAAPSADYAVHTYMVPLWMGAGVSGGTGSGMGGGLGMNYDSAGRIIAIDPHSPAASTTDSNGYSLGPDQMVTKIQGCNVQAYTATGPCVITSRTAGWIAMASPRDLIDYYISAFSGNGTTELSVETRREVSPQGKIWYMDFAHAIHIPHLTAAVWRGESPPDFSDSEPATGGFWVTTRVRTALNSILAPTAASYAAAAKCLSEELDRPHNNFRKHMNPVLQALRMQPLDGADGRIVEQSSGDVHFYSRQPEIVAVINLTFNSTLAGSPPPGWSGAPWSDIPALLQLPASAAEPVRIVRKDPNNPSWHGDDVHSERTLCYYGYGGPFLGCLDSMGRSVSLMRKHAQSLGKGDPYASGPLADANIGQPHPQADLVPPGFTQQAFDLLLILRIPVPPTASQSQRETIRSEAEDFYSTMIARFRNDSLSTSLRTAGSLAAEDDLRAAGVCGGSVSVLMEENDVAPYDCTPAPTGLPPQNDSRATPIPELAPFDEGWEGTSAAAGRRLLQIGEGLVAPGRTLLQYRPKERRGQRNPVLDAEGNAVFDPQRRVERIRLAESMLESQPEHRRAQTLQFDEGLNPGTVQRPNWTSCTVGHQGPTYGLISSLYDLPNMPISGTFQKCKRACEEDPRCHAFTREAIGVPDQDNSPADCYLKRTVLPYCGDQYSFEEWGTYVVRCPNEAPPCTWTVLHDTALHVIEEYQTKRHLNNPQECREVCEALPECMGTTWRKRVGGAHGDQCYLIHEQEGRSVNHDEFTSYVCKRKHAAPSPWTAYTPAPPHFGSCGSEGEHCNDVPHGLCLEGKGTYRCSCGTGYMCAGCADTKDTSCHCFVPHAPKLCVPIQTKAPLSACDDDSAAVCGAANSGSTCYQLGAGQYECGCESGYHCDRSAAPPCSSRAANESKSCVPDTCLDKMIGPDLAYFFQSLPLNPSITTGPNAYAISPTDDVPMRGQLLALKATAWCGTCADLATLLTFDENLLANPAHQQMVRDARAGCYNVNGDTSGLPPTPAPTPRALMRAWQDAVRETLQECSDRQGSCLQIELERVDPLPEFGDLHIDACPPGGCTGGDERPMEPVDVSITYYPVHSTRTHRVTLTLINVSVQELLGGSGGIDSDPLQAIREQLSEHQSIPLDDITLTKICAERALTGDELGCFDMSGNPEAPPGSLDGLGPDDELAAGEMQSTICEAKSRATWSQTDPSKKIGWTGQTKDCDEDLCCPAGETVKILDAFFGRKHCGRLCYAWPEESRLIDGRPQENCLPKYCNITDGGDGACDCDYNNWFPGKPLSEKHTTAKKVMRRCCQDKQCCNANATDWAGHHGDPCPGMNKYLWVKWTCVPNSTTPQSHQANAGSRKAGTLQDAAAQCADGDCRIRVTLDMKLDGVAIHRLLRMPGGQLVQLEPGEAMPSNTRVVESMGAEAPEDELDKVADSNALKSIMEQRKLPFVSEAVQVLVDRHARDWAESFSGGRLEAVCHEETRAPAVDCSRGYCRPADAADTSVRRTSCAGTPACTSADCNFIGAAAGFLGQCLCDCPVGYAGSRCQQCDVGFSGFPKCTALAGAKSKSPAPAKAVPQTVPAVQTRSAAVNKTITIPTDAELRVMKLAGVIAEAERLGLATEGLESKKEYVAAIQALRQRRQRYHGEQVESPAPSAAAVPFHLATSLTLARVHRSHAALREVIAALSTDIGALNVRMTWACAAAVCSPECPRGRVSEWSPDQQQSCERLSAVVPAELDEGSGSVIEFEIDFAPGSDTAVRAAVAEALLSKTARLGNSPLSDYAVLGVAHALPDDTSSHLLATEAGSADYERLSFWLAAAAAAVVILGLLAQLLGRRRDRVHWSETEPVRSEPAAASSDAVIRFSIPCSRFMEHIIVPRLAQELGVRPGSIVVSAVSAALDDTSACVATVRVAGMSGRDVAEHCNKAPTTAELPISGAYAAKDEAVLPTEHSAAELWVHAASGVAGGCSGPYKRLPSVCMSGKPVWCNSQGTRWLYCSAAGKWTITDKQQDFRTGDGLLTAAEPAEWPSEVPRTGWRAGSEPVEVLIADRCPVVHGFRVGQQVYAAEDITEKGQVVIEQGRIGVVQGQAAASNFGISVRFAHVAHSVDVTPDEVDHVSGPTVEVLSPQKVWRECVVVNQRNDRVKVHYVGYDHAYSEWIERDSDRIRNAGSLA